MAKVFISICLYANVLERQGNSRHVLLCKVKEHLDFNFLIQL